MSNVAFSSFIKDPPKMKFDGEDDDEKIILFLRRHLVTNTRRILIVIAMSVLPFVVTALFALNDIDIIGLMPFRYRFTAHLFWYLVVFGYAFESFLVWYFNVYLVTNKRIVDMDFYGLLHRNIAEAPLRNVEDITRKVGGAAQIVFNFGNVIIQTAGEKRELEFEYVPNPARVQDIISDLVSELRFHHGGS